MPLSNQPSPAKTPRLGRQDDRLAPCNCKRVLRYGWSMTDYLEWPIGVYAVESESGSRRYHAMFGASATSKYAHLGCFQTKAEASAAWDSEARRRGWRLVNTPLSPFELPIVDDVRSAGELIGRLGFPHVATNRECQLEMLDGLLSAARSGGIERSWVGGEQSPLALALQQQEHRVAPGNRLCFSCCPHAFETRKARTASPGWVDQQPKLSAAEWLAFHERNRVRAARAVLERSADTCVPSTDGASYDPVYATALQTEIIIQSGATILNFQPLLAAALYRKFGPTEGCVVFDPCAGWGGRMLGAAAAGNVVSYSACEPAAATHAGLQLLSSLVHERMPDLKIEVLKQGAEDTPQPAGTVDVVFTSPPYFNLELYSSKGEHMGEPTQSHVRYQDPSAWAELFLSRLIGHAHVMLKPGGYLCLNVSNNNMLTSAGLDLEGAVRAHAKRVGFLIEQPLGMLKPHAEGRVESLLYDLAERRKQSGAQRAPPFEPIFVFRKAEASCSSSNAWTDWDDARLDEALAKIPLPAPTTPLAPGAQNDDCQQGSQSSICTPPTISIEQAGDKADAVPYDGMSTPPYYNPTERAWVVMCTCGERMYYMCSDKHGPYYSCPACKLTHGAHKHDGSFERHRSHERGAPLGIPCDAETQQLRHEAHALLDKLWTTPEQRSRVYRIASTLMDLPPEKCHIAAFGMSQCKQLMEHLRNEQIPW